MFKQQCHRTYTLTMIVLADFPVRRHFTKALYRFTIKSESSICIFDGSILHNIQSNKNELIMCGIKEQSEFFHF